MVYGWVVVFKGLLGPLLHSLFSLLCGQGGPRLTLLKALYTSQHNTHKSMPLYPWLNLPDGTNSSRPFLSFLLSLFLASLSFSLSLALTLSLCLSAAYSSPFSRQ